jgi:hypothetical protein
MNLIAHTTLGLHISNVGFYQRYGRRATLILAAASLFPDIDSVTFFMSRETYSQYHRVFTIETSNAGFSSTGECGRSG